MNARAVDLQQKKENMEQENVGDRELEQEGDDASTETGTLSIEGESAVETAMRLAIKSGLVLWECDMMQNGTDKAIIQGNKLRKKFIVEQGNYTLENTFLADGGGHLEQSATDEVQRDAIGWLVFDLDDIEELTAKLQEQTVALTEEAALL